MTSKEEPKSSGNMPRTGSLGKFLLGDELGPLNSRNDYQARLKILPAEQREFAEESTHLADLWQYFSEHKMQLPGDVIAEVAELSKLPQQEQVRVLRAVNLKLMEYLHDVSEDSGIRQ
jgi:hypothetical protein